MDAADKTDPITVVVADDDPQIRATLSALLEEHPRLAVVAVASDGRRAAKLAADHQPQLAVVDVMMPGGGTEATRAIHAVSSRTAVVCYTALSDRRTRERLLEAGAAAVLVKGRACNIADQLVALVPKTRASIC